jgi:hypothetical protein
VDVDGRKGERVYVDSRLRERVYVEEGPESEYTKAPVLPINEEGKGTRKKGLLYHTRPAIWGRRGTMV